MKTNIGSFDAATRFLLGWIFIFLGNHGLGWWALLGLWPILTGAFGFCPLYILFHINTAEREEANEARHHKDSTKVS